MRTVTKYSLLQLPGLMILGTVLWLLRDWGWISTATALIVAALWIGKDILLYPLFRPALEERAADPGPAGLVGARGVCRTPIDDRGTVEIGGEWWQARTTEQTPIHPGERIFVVHQEGMILTVRRRQEES